MNRERHIQAANGRIMESLNNLDRYQEEAEQAAAEGSERAAEIYLTLCDISMRAAKSEQAFIEAIEIDGQMAEVRELVLALVTKRQEKWQQSVDLHEANREALRGLGIDVDPQP